MLVLTLVVRWQEQAAVRSIDRSRGGRTRVCAHTHGTNRRCRLVAAALAHSLTRHCLLLLPLIQSCETTNIIWTTKASAFLLSYVDAVEAAAAAAKAESRSNLQIGC